VAAIARNLRVAVSGGASLPVEIIRQVQDRFGVQILEGYGLSETSAGGHVQRPRAAAAGRFDRHPDLGRRGEAHRPHLEDDRGSDEVGEIAIRGHNSHEGLPQPARGDGRGHARRLVPYR
jgi:long-chain acyl-CoA synthetase